MAGLCLGPYWEDYGLAGFERVFCNGQGKKRIWKKVDGKKM